MFWSFAIVNNKLAEIFLNKGKNGRTKILGHCYVKKSGYKTKQEQNWIREDTKKSKFIYRNKRYKPVDA